jgi:hypothetical protein
MTDYTIYIKEDSKLGRTKQLYEAEKLGLKVVGQEHNAIIVKATEKDIEKVKKLDWVESTELYDCFVILAPSFNIMRMY